MALLQTIDLKRYFGDTRAVDSAVKRLRAKLRLVSKEVDTIEAIKALLKQQKQVVVPKVEDNELRLYRIDSLDDLVPGSFDILEPKSNCQFVTLSDIDVFVVPGFAFDRMGYRLGWGKGYYDRLLASVTAPKIGLAYSLQILPRLDHATYDIPMDTVITEHETYSP